MDWCWDEILNPIFEYDILNWNSACWFDKGIWIVHRKITILFTKEGLKKYFSTSYRTLFFSILEYDLFTQFLTLNIYGEFDTLLFFFFNMKIKDERVIGHLLISKSSFIGCVGAKKIRGWGSQCPIFVKFPNYSGDIQIYWFNIWW